MAEKTPGKTSVRRRGNSFGLAMVILLITVVAAVVLMIGRTLTPDPPNTAVPIKASNEALPVTKLFTDENGFSIYRFYDEREYRYYVTGPGVLKTMTEHSRTRPAGKSVVTVHSPDEIQTVSP